MTMASSIKDAIADRAEGMNSGLDDALDDALGEEHHHLNMTVWRMTIRFFRDTVIPLSLTTRTSMPNAIRR